LDSLESTIFVNDLYSKEEIKKLRTDFWDGFHKFSASRRRKLGKPKKWVMQNTGINAIDLKFHIDHKRASVGIDVVSKSLDKKVAYWNKFLGVQNLLNQEFEQEVIWDDMYTLDSGKDIIRIAVYKNNVDILDKSCWWEVYGFFFENMIKFENWFEEYKDILRVPQVI